jgi:hypothetical protein
VAGKARIQGDVGVLSDALALGAGTRVTGSAAAPSITLERGVTVADEQIALNSKQLALAKQRFEAGSVARNREDSA